MELDSIDLTIVNELMKDGCLSLRDISKVTGLSAPALSSRIKRMKDAGIIKGTTVIIDRSKVSYGISVLLLIKCDPSKNGFIVQKLSSFEEITDVYKVSGSYSIMVKAEVENMDSLNMLDEKTSGIDGVTEINTLIVNEYTKEQQKPFKRLKVNLKCEYCGNPISGRPYEIEYMGITRFFCCPTCLREFKEKYGIN
ncbi:MAG: winged helix-turn-helix transcriptional regulator [Nitrososphaeria archaeon]